MNKRERFLATIDRKKTDRPASWLGIPDTKALPGLYKYFNVDNFNDFKKIIDDDVWVVELPFHSPVSDAIYAAFDFAKKDTHSLEERTLTSPGFFEDYEDVQDVNLFDWPDPSKYISEKECFEEVMKVPEGYAALGVIWSAHFQDACAAFGMEDALVKMSIAPELFRAVIDKITEFYLAANKIFYESTKGRLDAVLIGNDFGTQNGLIVSPDSLREFVFPGTKKLVEQAKSYGLKVIHHSCGSVEAVIPDLIELGVDVIHPIQALAKNMDPYLLKEKYSDKVSFCGGVDAQYLLVNGTPEQIRDKVAELKELFPTGLIISPSHEAILPDVPAQNIEALFKNN